MFSYNTIINFTELYKQEPNSTCAGLQFKVQQPAPAQVVLSLHNLQNIWFASTSFVSHGKSFSQVRTNFRTDEDLHVDVLPPAESSLALFRPLVVLFDNRNALISMTIMRGL